MAIEVVSGDLEGGGCYSGAGLSAGGAHLVEYRGDGAVGKEQLDHRRVPLV